MTSPIRSLSTATGVTGGRRAASWRLGWLAAALVGLGALGAAIVAAATPVAAASLDLSWQAPTTNVDDSSLTDLSSYNVYVATSSPACRSGLPIKVVSPVPAPKAGDVITYQVSGVTAGTTYAVAVSAVNRAGIEGSCSFEAIGVARSNFTVTPGRVDFGSADVGTSVDRTFTINNVGSASLSVTVVAPAPFAVVSDGPYTVLPGATQNIVVRFSPTIDATFSTNASVITDGDTVSVPITGTATRPSDPPGSGGASLTLFYSGKLRDRVGADNRGLHGDGALDGTLTATLTAADGRTITRLRLQSNALIAPGSWDTDAATSAWALGVASTLDGALLNDAATMAVNFTVADGGTFRLFAADYADLEFAPDVTLTLTATFSDGTTATGVAVATAVVPTDLPSLALTYDGKLRDRVGQASVGLNGDGALDGTLTATLSALGGRTITRLHLQSSAPGSWDTDPTSSAWALGVARTLDGPFLNDPVTVAVNFVVADGGSFRIFAADFAGLEFAPGRTLTLTATLSDGTTLTAVTSGSLDPPSIRLSYDGKFRDRVGAGARALGPDGALDGTLTVTIATGEGRTLSRVRLRSSAPGSWDTDATTGAWLLGVAPTLDGALLNDPATMAVSFTVADGATFSLFAADWADLEFAPGTTLTVTAFFADGTTASASTIAEVFPPPTTPSLALTYNGKLRDRVGAGSVDLGADGAPDGTLTVRLSATGGRTITGLQLHSSALGSWDTDASTAAWVLGVATSIDSPLLNDPGTMAVNLTVADGARFRLFAADYADSQFIAGTTLTVTAVFSDGTSVSATTIAEVIPMPPSLTLSYDGKLRDRVGADSVALGADGALDGTLTVTLNGPGRTLTHLQLQSSAPGTWDTDAATGAWVLGVAPTLDGVLLNDPATMAVHFVAFGGGSFRLFAADWADVEFAPGTTLTVTAVFADGTTASASTVVTASPPPTAPSLALTYNGKLRDRVGAGSVALGADGALDGTLAVTLHASGGRTITRLQLHSSAPGSWDTDITRSAWVVGMASTLDSALLNDPVTMAVNVAVGDGETFRLFAADWADIEFVPGTTLSVTASFSDGTSTTGSVTVP